MLRTLASDLEDRCTELVPKTSGPVATLSFRTCLSALMRPRRPAGCGRPG